MSYEMIDRYLRNNLHDDDYAEYSAALDALAAVRQPLTEAQIDALHREWIASGMNGSLSFARAVERAHGIGA